MKVKLQTKIEDIHVALEDLRIDRKVLERVHWALMCQIVWNLEMIHWNLNLKDRQ